MQAIALDTSELPKLSELPTRTALREAASYLARLVREPGFLGTEILPLLDQARGVDDWYVANRHDGLAGSCSLQVFVWPPGARTRIHDHTSWGAFCCAVGFVLEERYERLDDGSRAEHARLGKAWQLAWTQEDGASTVLPRERGIHRVGNPGQTTAVSVHLYGPRVDGIDGCDYDPSCDYVCDRKEDDRQGTARERPPSLFRARRILLANRTLSGRKRDGGAAGG